jgi:serine/threonine protein kinase
MVKQTQRIQRQPATSEDFAVFKKIETHLYSAARGKTVDRRCDIWSFGAVLFEMLSSKQAFAGEDVSQTLAAVIMKEPDWEALPVTTPPSIQRLVRRCLNKDPKQRLPTSAMPVL